MLWYASLASGVSLAYKKQANNKEAKSKGRECSENRDRTYRPHDHAAGYCRSEYIRVLFHFTSVNKSIYTVRKTIDFVKCPVKEYFKDHEDAGAENFYLKKDFMKKF